MTPSAGGRVHRGGAGARRGSTTSVRARRAGASRAGAKTAGAAPRRLLAEPSPAQLLDLQRDAGNRAVTALIRPLQRAGGWMGADTKAGKGIAAGEPQTGWNVEEHAVGGIRRIPLDGLTGGLQKSPTESESAKKLTDEKVVGAVKGAPRSDADQQQGRGRAIALVPSLIKPTKPVDVLFHLHGNTEFEGRGFGGWRQHEKSAEVRDVARDRIAQQIEAANSAQIVGILPQGVNESNFGQISPDAYIRDAFDRLTEVGAWNQAPPSFRVVLSAHSGGGFTLGRMIKGWKGYQLPANVKTLVLFEALHARPNDPDPKRRFDQVADFGSWIEGMLSDHLAYLNDPAVSATDKQARLDAATQVRLYWDPNKSYNGIYVRMEDRIKAWFAARQTKLGANEKTLRDLVVFVPKPGATHEGIVGAGITESLTATAGSAGAAAPPPVPVPAGGGTRAAPGARSFADREAAISADMVAAQAGSQGATAGGLFRVATGFGFTKLSAAAMVLSAAGNRSEVDLTDALFGLVHTELEGGRIADDREDLKGDWRMIRRDYARPVLAAPAVAPVAPFPPAPVVAAPETPATVDPATVKPAKAATGVKAMTADEKKKALEAAVKQVTTAGKQADQEAVANTLLFNDSDTASWWGGMAFDASFLDVPIQPSGGSVTGVHSELYARLVKAENKLQSLFPGLSKAQIAGKMGIYQILGVRPPKKATGGSLPSYHCFGLAIDINHPTNPFVGNQKPTLDTNKDKKVTAEEQAKYDLYMESRSPRIIERAMLLLHGEQFDIEKAIKVPKGAGTAAGRLWEIHHRASETLAEYLRLAADLDGQKLKSLVEARRKAGDSRDLEFWKQRIADDKVLIKPWDFMHHKSPEKGGYMDLGKELVEALVEDGNLLWGGSYGGAKDMMHFDWRGGTISKRPPKGWKPPAR